MPENSNYVISTDSEEPRVSVKLDLKNDAQLTSDQVEGIYALVLNSLPGLERENISILDSDGKLLSGENTTVEEDVLYQSRLNFQEQMQSLLKSQLNDTLTSGVTGSFLPIFNTASEVGYGAVIASLAGFTLIRDAVLQVSSNPLVSEAVAMNVLAGITGSSSGGLSIALQTLGAEVTALENVMLAPRRVLKLPADECRKLAIEMLEKVGHKITVAGNGQEALDYFDKERFDLILMDVQMPVMGGLEATQAIRAREARRTWAAGGQWRSTPIVAMTAHAMQGDRDRCLAAGMDDYIAKPIKPAELRAVIERIIGDMGAVEAEEKEAEEGSMDFEADDSAADLDATRELLDGDEGALQQLIGLFFADLERNRKALEQAQRAGDFTTIRNLAHTIKGSAGVFNAESVMAAARRLETLARDSDAAGVRRELPVLLAEQGKLAGVLRKARKT